MNVQEIMTTDVVTCRLDDTLNAPAAIMWGHDCGVVPVVDEDGRVVGMITDRDICMAAYTQGAPLSAIRVASACSRTLRACRLDDPVEEAEAIMAAAQVRRLPVVDREGRLFGVVSLSDLVQHARPADKKPDGLSFDRVAATLAAISHPTHATA